MLISQQVSQNNEGGMFRRQRQGMTMQKQAVVYALLISFVVLGGIWFLFFSGFFDVHKIELSKLQVLGEGAVRGEIEAYFNQPKQHIWGNRNIFSLDEQDLAKYLSSKLFVDNLTVDKSYPNILRLKIKERQRSVVLVTNTDIYIVDDYGVISDRADTSTAATTRQFLTGTTPIETSKEIYVIAPISASFEKGQSFASSTRVRAWLELGNKLRDAGVWFRALQIQPEPLNTLYVILKENKNVILDLDQPVDGQVETLRQFILTKPKWSDINEYIDVRIPGKIYYK